MSEVQIVYKHHTLELSSINAHHIYIQPNTKGTREHSQSEIAHKFPKAKQKSF